MTLTPNRAVLLWRALAWGLTLAGAIGARGAAGAIEPRRLALPVTLVALTLVLVLFIDAQFIGGFRPLDSGDDGLTYEGFARRIVRHLLSGDFVAALKGEENVFYFSPGLRYFRALERFVFGDTFLGYLSMILAFPLLVFALFRRFLTPRWALVIVLLFVATPAGALFGSSLFYYGYGPGAASPIPSPSLTSVCRSRTAGARCGTVCRRARCACSRPACCSPPRRSAGRNLSSHRR